MCGGILCMAAMDAGVSYLVRHDMPVVQVIALRSWVLTVAMVAWVLRRAGPGALRTRRLRDHLVRGAVGALAPLTFFIALGSVPLADATAVFFLSVFIMTVASTRLFGERVDGGGWAAVALGFTGVMVITRPGADSFRPEILLVLVASVCYCVIMLMGRWMSRTESNFSLVLSYNLVSLAVFTVLLPWYFGPITATLAAVLALVTALTLAGHFLLTAAFNVGPVSVVAPFEYSALVWAALFGYWLWDEIPDSVTVAGMIMIAGSGLFIAWRERPRKRI